MYGFLPPLIGTTNETLHLTKLRHHQKSQAVILQQSKHSKNKIYQYASIHSKELHRIYGGHLYQSPQLKQSEKLSSKYQQIQPFYAEQFRIKSQRMGINDPYYPSSKSLSSLQIDTQSKASKMDLQNEKIGLMMKQGHTKSDELFLPAVGSQRFNQNLQQNSQQLSPTNQNSRVRPVQTYNLDYKQIMDDDSFEQKQNKESSQQQQQQFETNIYKDFYGRVAYNHMLPLQQPVYIQERKEIQLKQNVGDSNNQKSQIKTKKGLKKYRSIAELLNDREENQSYGSFYHAHS